MFMAAKLLFWVYKFNQKLWVLYIPILLLLFFFTVRHEFPVYLLKHPYWYIYHAAFTNNFGHEVLNLLLSIALVIIQIGTISFIIGTLQKLKSKLKNRCAPK